MSNKWKSAQEEFAADHAATGISAKDWCAQRGINYATARRHLKTRAQSAQSAQPEVRKTAQSKAKDGAHSQQGKTDKRLKGKDKNDFAHNSESAHDSETNNNSVDGRGDAGRFTDGNRESEGNQGNPNPLHKWQPGEQLTKSHGGYAKYLDADDLFDQAEAMKLRDELSFTRARALSVTKVLNELQKDIARATALDERGQLYDKYLKAEQALDRNIARIESIERSLKAIDVDTARVPHIKAATRKLTAEADRLEKDGGSESTPVSEMVAELQSMGTGGLMS